MILNVYAMIQFTRKNGRSATAENLSRNSKRYSLLEKMVDLQQSAVSLSDFDGYSLLEKMVDLQLYVDSINCSGPLLHH